MDIGKHRYTIVVTRIDGHRVFATLPSGRETSVGLTVLAYGRRSARLVQHADGRSAEPPKCGAAPPSKASEDTKTASDYIKTKRPKGIAKAGDKEREALHLKEVDGWTVKRLTAFYKVSTGTMSAWLSRAREAREDERNLGRTG